jgi:hypothetical protein
MSHFGVEVELFFHDFIRGESRYNLFCGAHGLRISARYVPSLASLLGMDRVRTAGSTGHQPVRKPDAADSKTSDIRDIQPGKPDVVPSSASDLDLSPCRIEAHAAHVEDLALE